jgi:hypothetical protein
VNPLAQAALARLKSGTAQAAVLMLRNGVKKRR